MDTYEFLKHILPAAGPYYILMSEEGKKKKHYVVESIWALAEKITQLDRKGLPVWHACASYASRGIPTGEMREGEHGTYEKLDKRVQENVAKVRSFWIDLDCGDAKAATGKGYATQREALLDVARFCRETELPMPLTVNSGYGVHCYWVMSEDISGVMWTRIAEMFKRVLTHHGVKHDPSRTSDRSSVLRPVGAHNRKGTEPRPVQVGNVPGIVDIRSWCSRLGALTAALPAAQLPPREHEFGEVPAHLCGNVDNSDLGAREFDDSPKDAEKILTGCQQIRRMVENPNDVTEGQWYAMLGVVKVTKTPEETAMRWSEGHRSYSPDETLAKLAQWTYSPTTCDKFNQEQSGICEHCPHFGKIKSPALLGRETKIPEPRQHEIVDGSAIELPELLRRRGYTITDEGIVHVKENPDGEPVQTVVANLRCWPTSWDSGSQTNVESSSSWTIHNQDRGDSRQVTLMTGVAAAGGVPLAQFFGQHGLMFGPQGPAGMQNYIKAWMDHLRSNKDTLAARQFGWQRDQSFVLGELRFMPDGSIEQARLVGDTASPRYANVFDPEGELDVWRNIVDRAYNQPGQQQYQFMFGVGFGAPLVNVLGQVAGITINGWSARGGMGKSTAAQLALSIYGNPDKLTRAEMQSTVAAMYAHMGVMNSLPILFDEVTNINPKALSGLLYTVATGVGRERLNQNGSMSDTGQSWQTMVMVTANKSLVNTVSAEKSLASGELCRVFEYGVEATSKLSVHEAKELFQQSHNYGHAGRIYIQYIVANREAVHHRLLANQRRIDRDMEMGAPDRFMSAAMTCIYTGLQIAADLGLVKFDMELLYNWMLERRLRHKTAVAYAENDASAAFATMLQQMQGNILTTNIEGDRRSNVRANPLRHVNGEVMGRRIINTNRLYLAVTAIQAWCAKTQTDIEAMRQALVKDGVFVCTEKYSLGKGMDDYTLPQCRVWVLDTTTFAGAVEDENSNVTPLRAAG